LVVAHLQASTRHLPGNRGVLGIQRQRLRLVDILVPTEPGKVCLGPKQQGRAEFGPDLPEAASLLVTDSLAQIGAYHPPNVLVGTPHEQRLVSLGAVRAGETEVPAGGISVFFSGGLAGTEAFLLDRLASIDQRRLGA
jgi:hypothetical protein